jgi:outer membrane protein assembly factor BamB
VNVAQVGRLTTQWQQIVEGNITTPPISLYNEAINENFVVFAAISVASKPDSTVFDVYALINNTSPVLWKKSITGFSASKRIYLVQDPRSGFWIYAQNSTDLSLLRLSEKDGEVIQVADFGGLIGSVCDKNECVISSHATISHANADVYLFLGVLNRAKKSSFVFALDLTTLQIAWRYELAQSNNTIVYPIGQFPVAVDDNWEPYVVFNTNVGDIYAIGAV